MYMNVPVCMYIRLRALNPFGSEEVEGLKNKEFERNVHEARMEALEKVIG